jgi:hypothetical protein
MRDRFINPPTLDCACSRPQLCSKNACTSSSILNQTQDRRHAPAAIPVLRIRLSAFLAIEIGMHAYRRIRAARAQAPMPPSMVCIAPVIIAPCGPAI